MSTSCRTQPSTASARRQRANHQVLPQEAAVSEAASSSNDDVATRSSARDEFVTTDSFSSEVETRSGGTKRAASRLRSQAENEEAMNNNSVAGGDLSAQSPNKRVRLNDTTTTTSSAPPTPSPLRPEESPATPVGGLFASVPLCIDAGALTGRIWCPVNMRNEPDPHWKEFPRNWGHPANPGEGTCHISDLDYPDSSIPDWIHQDHASHAAQGTLISSIMETLAWSHAVVDNCGYDFENDPLQYKTPKTLRRRLETQPFTFPTTGRNPFMGIVLPFGWGPASDVSLLYRPSSEPNPLSAEMYVPPPLPSTLFSDKEFWNANNKAVKSGSATPDGAPNETPIKELGKGLVEFPVSVKKKRSGPAECGIGQGMDVDAMEIDTDAVGQHDEGCKKQPDNEAQVSIEAKAMVGTNTKPKTTTEGDIPEPTANIVAMNVEPALGLPVWLPISENEHHPANNHINNPLPATIPALSLYDPPNFADGNVIAQTLSLNDIDPANIDVLAAQLAHAESRLPDPTASQPLKPPPQIQLQQPPHDPAQQSTTYPADPSDPMPTLTAALHPPEPHPRFQMQHNTNLDPQDPSNYDNNMYMPADTAVAKPGESAYAAHRGCFFGAQPNIDPNPDLNLDPSLGPKPTSNPSQGYYQNLTHR